MGSGQARLSKNFILRPEGGHVSFRFDAASGCIRLTIISGVWASNPKSWDFGNPMKPEAVAWSERIAADF